LQRRSLVQRNQRDVPIHFVKHRLPRPIARGEESSRSRRERRKRSKRNNRRCGCKRRRKDGEGAVKGAAAKGKKAGDRREGHTVPKATAVSAMIIKAL
jgi:hypothetical protein